MKKLILLCGAAAMIFGSCGTTGGTPKSEDDSLAYIIGYNWGTALRELDPEIDINVIAAGMRDGVKGDTAAAKIDQQAAQSFWREYFTVRKPRKDSIASAEFIAKVEKENKNVKKAESGFLYEIIEEGEAPKPDSASTVKVMFKLSDRTGKVIQEINEERGPVDMNLRQVLPAWAEGLQLIGKGGKIKLWLPAELGYGKQGNQMVPPNSALVFEVDLVDIVTEDDAAAAE